MVKLKLKGPSATGSNSGIWLFIFLFYFTMSLSKYAHVLYFQEVGQLTNYALSYSAMAVTGACSFLLTPFFSKWGLRKTASLFLPIYAVGMALRIVPNHLLVAVLSGGLSGIGASAVLLVMRSWLFHASDKQSSAKESLVSARYTIMQVALVVGTLLGGVFLSLFSDSHWRFGILLLSASLIMAALIFVPGIPDNPLPVAKTNRGLALPQNKHRGLQLFWIVMLLGMASGFVQPILPAILRQEGLSIYKTSVTLTLLGLVTVCASFIFQRLRLEKNSRHAFLGNQLFIGSLVIGGSFFYSEGQVLLVSLFAFMAASTAGFFIFKELMEYDMFPKAERLRYLGLAQSGFLVGDAVGAPVGTAFFQEWGTQVLLMGYGVLALTCGVGYYLVSKGFVRRQEKNVNDYQKDRH